jgi:hypothetical protein
MPSELRTLTPQLLDPLPGPGMLNIESFSYEDRRVIYPAVSEALDLCGCWLLSRRQTSLTQVEFHFELQLRWIVDLYASLVAAGLELTRASHHNLTVTCMVRKHQEQPSGLIGVMTALLVVNFLEDVCLPVMSIGSAHA